MPNQGYVCCIEGGGSKTSLEVFNNEGQLVAQKQIQQSSNVNTIGVERIRAVVKELFEGMESFQPHCRLVAGMAGAARSASKELLKGVFAELGLDENLILLGDAEMGLKLLNGPGMVLISGTGSVCFGSDGENKFQAGGLGPDIGDPGSGLSIGQAAIEIAMGEELIGKSSPLTTAIKKHFQVTHLGDLPESTVTSYSLIAGAAPVVFELAQKGDRVAKTIICQAAENLALLVKETMEKAKLTKGPIHLYGGVFKNLNAEAFIEQIIQNIPGGENLTFVNRSKENVASLFAKQFLFIPASS